MGGATGEEHALSFSSNSFSGRGSGMLRMGMWKIGGGVETGGLGDSGGASIIGVVFKGILPAESIDCGLELTFLLGDSCALH